MKRLEPFAAIFHAFAANFREPAVSDPACLRRPLLAAAVFLAAALCGACQAPLALQHPFFVSPGRSVAALDEETRHVLAYNGALQAARRACLATPPAGTWSQAYRERGEDGVRSGDPCARSYPSSVASRGSVLDAYRRWLEDKVRDLPDPSKTATRAGAE